MPQEIKKFTDGIRVLLLIHRNKEGGTGSLRKQKKLVSRNSEEFIKCFYQLRDEMNDNQRIYATLNARNIDKAILAFKRRQLNADYANDKDFYFDIKNRWISCLMKNKLENNFLIDCDTEEESRITLMELEALDINILSRYNTKQGEHIITEPFNYTKLTYSNKVAKDGLMLLSF